MRLTKILPIFVFFLFVMTFISAEYSIDISGIKNEEYKIGENLQVKVILLEDGKIIEKNIELFLTDALNKKQISRSVTSNSIVEIPIEGDSPSGLWSMKVSYEGVEVERDFLIGENSEVEFEINDDELIIRNIGNVRYTKTIQITIGDETNSYAQNLGVGEEKILKLISPEGSYNIFITDGTTSIKRDNVELHGTGNVVGAVNKELVGYTGFAGAEDLESEDNEKFISLDKLPLALIFVVAVIVLVALIVFERKLSKKNQVVRVKKLVKKSKKNKKK